MELAKEFRNHAATCIQMSRSSNDPEINATWLRMAERWLVCAKVAEDQISHTHVPRDYRKQHRKPTPKWLGTCSGMRCI
jgi:hypothetical protein